MKREAGTGSVYKLNGKRHKPWVAIAPTSYDSLGRRTKMVIGTFRTKKEAAEALARYSLSPFDSSATLEDVYQMYISKERNITQDTIDAYDNAWRKLEPLKDMKITKIKTYHIQKVIDTMYPSTQKMAKVLLKLIYKVAMENDIVTKDYSAFITIAQPKKKEKEIFTEEEIQKLWENKDIKVVPSVLVMIYSGMRIGEMLNLKPENCDLESNLFVKMGEKTKAGKERVVPIHPLIRGFIEERMHNEKIFYSATERAYRYEYEMALKEIGIPYKSPHSCRHTFATRLSHSSSPLIIQKLIGHANYSLTANVYSHPDVESLKEAVDNI